MICTALLPRTPALLVVLLLSVVSVSARPAAQAPSAAASRENSSSERQAERKLRDDALRRAQVWMEPAVAIEDVRFDTNPGQTAGTPLTGDISCRLEVEPASGTTPKFRCVLPDGEEVRVKYGRGNPEVFTEVAATRLLSALGFPTDHVYVVSSVRCAGCPPDPFTALQGCWSNRAIRPGCLEPKVVRPTELFETATVERRLAGEKIEAHRVEGWGWKELSKVDARAGGATRAQLDALRLMAVFLAHWDNKPENQRLVCLDADKPAAGRPCRRPLAIVQDIGGTFGPPKLNLRTWAATPIWADASCRVSMRALPYGGSSFADTVISEEGRAFLADRIGRLSDAQIRQLFEGARFARAAGAGSNADAVIEGWVAAFKDKRRAILDRRCPAAAATRVPDGQ